MLKSRTSSKLECDLVVVFQISSVKPLLPEKVVGTGDGCAEVVQMISVDVSDSTLHFLPEIVLTKGITMNKNMCLKFIL